jgi:glycosyltransferase involved in cell wall biosynthesis
MSTARDLAAYYPEVAMRPMAVVPCAVSEVFRTHSVEEIAAFRAASGIDKPYFLLVGRRDRHKNVALFFRAFAKLANRADYALVMAGTTQPLEPELRAMAGDAEGYAGFFTDEALSLVYSGAVALVYPSLYEGFGLPILEAMQSGCPVITCQNSSIPEVAGSAALYVGEDNVDEMLQTLLAVQQPEVREYLAKRGLQRAARFNWQCSAERLVQFIEEIDYPHV